MRPGATTHAASGLRAILQTMPRQAGVETVSRYGKGNSDGWPDTHNPRYAEALSLRYLAGLEPKECANALGVSSATFAVVLHRAQAALKNAADGDIADPADDASDRAGVGAALQHRGDGERVAALHQLVECFLDQALTLGVER